jgi:hypothetical protein
MPAIRWTKDEDDYLRSNYATASYDALAEQLGRSHAGIKDRARRIGASKRAKRVRWSDKDHAFLRDNRGTMSLSEIAAELGRTKAAIVNRCSIYFSGAPCDIKYSDLNEAHLNPFLTGKIGAKPNV